MNLSAFYVRFVAPRWIESHDFSNSCIFEGKKPILILTNIITRLELNVPQVVLATASPDKFPEAVEEAGLPKCQNPDIEKLFSMETR